MATYRYEIKHNVGLHGRLVKKLHIFGPWWKTVEYPDSKILDSQEGMRNGIQKFEKNLATHEVEVSKITKIKKDVASYDREEGYRGRPFGDRLGFFGWIISLLSTPKLPSEVDMKGVDKYYEFALSNGLVKDKIKLDMQPVTREVRAETMHSATPRNNGNNNQNQNNQNNQRNN